MIKLHLHPEQGNVCISQIKRCKKKTIQTIQNVSCFNLKKNKESEHFIVEYLGGNLYMKLCPSSVHTMTLSADTKSPPVQVCSFSLGSEHKRE